MNSVCFVKGNEALVRGEGSSYQIANFITKDTNTNVSLAVSELHGETSLTMNTQSDRIYYFLEGEAEFIFAEHTVKIEPHSALLVPKGTEYKMRGSFRAVLINAPAFDIANEKQIT